MAVKKTESTTKTKATPAKKEVKSAEKASEVKTEIKAEAKDVKEPAKKTTTRKASAKPTAEEVKKETVKKETAGKAQAAPEVKAAVHFELEGRSYTPEDLLKICKDVWKYDLNGKEEELGSVELYVKPEESVTYYVINGDIKGSFNI